MTIKKTFKLLEIVTLGLLVVASLASCGAGRPGESAYDIAVKQGFKGTEKEWIESLRGSDGQPGINGTDGSNGKNGVGIVNIEKTKTEGLVDTYTIYLSDGSTYTFTVTNGTNGGSVTPQPEIHKNMTKEQILENVRRRISNENIKVYTGDSGFVSVASTGGLVITETKILSELGSICGIQDNVIKAVISPDGRTLMEFSRPGSAIAKIVLDKKGTMQLFGDTKWSKGISFLLSEVYQFIAAPSSVVKVIRFVSETNFDFMVRGNNAEEIIIKMNEESLIINSEPLVDFVKTVEIPTIPMDAKETSLRAEITGSLLDVLVASQKRMA